VAGISPFALFAIGAPAVYWRVGRWLLLVPFVIIALGLFVFVGTANDNNGFGAVAAVVITYWGMLCGLAAFASFALFGFVVRMRVGRASPRRSPPGSKIQ
jgi:hypothetical protein